MFWLLRYDTLIPALVTLISVQGKSMENYVRNVSGSFRFLSDDEAREWLIVAARKTEQSAQALVLGCRATARYTDKHDDVRRHALGRIENTWRLISVVALLDIRIPSLPLPSEQQVEAIKKVGELTSEWNVVIASAEDVECLVSATIAEGSALPLENRTICVTTRCLANHPLILEWKEKRLVCDHKNFLAYSYGWVPNFASYVLIVTEVPVV